MVSIDYRKIRNVWEQFLIFCICGWLYEVVWCNLIENNRGFINNGYLFGPWLPIYGIGMTLIVLLFDRLKVERPWKIFVFGTLIATAAELIGSYIMSATMGRFLWDYSGYFLNFQGRIALKSSLYFGALILLGVYCVRPYIAKKQEELDGNTARNIISALITILFIADVIARFWLGSNI